MADTDVYVTANSIDLGRDGFCVVINPWVFLSEAGVVGENRKVAGTAGTVYRTKSLNELVVPLQMEVMGTVNQAGTPYGNIYDGLRDNVEYLRANLLVQNVGTITTTVTWPDASTISATAEWRGPFTVTPRALTGSIVDVTCTVVVPAGKFT